MKREDFEAQIQEFVRFYATEYGAKATFVVEEEDAGDPNDLDAQTFYSWLWIESLTRSRRQRKKIADLERDLAEANAKLETRDRYWEERLRDELARITFDRDFQHAQAKDGFRQFQEASADLTLLRQDFDRLAIAARCCAAAGVECRAFRMLVALEADAADREAAKVVDPPPVLAG